MGDGDSSDTPLTRVAYDGNAGPAKLLLEAGAAVMETQPCMRPSYTAARATTIPATIRTWARYKSRRGTWARGDNHLAACAWSGARPAQSPGRDSLVGRGLDGLPAHRQAGANVDIACRPAATKAGIGIEGQTPLIAAAAFGEVEMAQELLLAGATLSLRDETGSTAMDWARGYCNENENFDCAVRQVRKRQIVKLLGAHMSKRGEREERSSPPMPSTAQPSTPTSDNRSAALWSLLLLVAGALVLRRMLDIASGAVGPVEPVQRAQGTVGRAGAAARHRQRRQAAAAARTAVPAPMPEPVTPGADEQCVVCLDATMSHTFVPCGHYCVCESCADEIMAQPRAKVPALP